MSMHFPARLSARTLALLCLVLAGAQMLAACRPQPTSEAAVGGTDAVPAATDSLAEAPPTGPPGAVSATEGATEGASPAAKSTDALAAGVPTPNCPEARAATTAQTEGPYFTPDSPERTSLIEAGLGGTRLIVTGYVLTTDCRPVPGALLDFWQADDQGQYDNAGYRLRGHQFTDEAGRYRLETIVAGPYPGRTPHIHVKIQAPGQAVLTSQLYFPEEQGNAADGIFDPALLMDVQNGADGKVGSFDFVVDMNE